MKKGIMLLSIALLFACLAALPASARGSREPAPKPTPSPAPPAPTVPAWIDIPYVSLQVATIPHAGSIVVQMQVTLRTYTSGGRREFVGTPSFTVVARPNGLYAMTSVAPARVERSGSVVRWSQLYHCWLVGPHATPRDPCWGMPQFIEWMPLVYFSLPVGG